MLGSLIIFLRGRRRTMFQLSGFYYKPQAVATQRSESWVTSVRWIGRPGFLQVLWNESGSGPLGFRV